MHANVKSQSQLYVQGYTRFIDRWGDEQSLLVVSEKRCMLRTLPTVVRLKAPAGTQSVSPGGSISCKLQLQRTSNFSGPMQISLMQPPLGVHADPITLKAGQNELEAIVNVSDDALTGRHELRFRAPGCYPEN